MLVCAHGDVSNFCKRHDMVIIEEYKGDLEKYKGVSRVVVTDRDTSEYEYYFLKGKLLARGVELVSTRISDNSSLADFVIYSAQREGELRRQKYGGRYSFGFQCVDGVVKLHESGRRVVKRIFELHDIGCSYRMIREDPGVHHPDGRKLSVSTVQAILKNREKYEKEKL